MPSKILIAEDEEITAELIAELLEELGHQATTAANGRKALELLSRESFDLLLTDIQMPEMDGLELIKALRDKDIGKELQIVILTAFGKFELAQKAMEMGVHHFLLKPFEPIDLQKKVEYCLEVQKTKAAKKQLEEEIEKDLQEAAHVQKAILMKDEEAVAIANGGGLKLAAFHTPYLHTNGDFFFVKKISAHATGFFLADVCGHGAAAAMIGMRILSLVEITVPQSDHSPKEFLSQMHNDILPMIPRERFAACTYAIYDHQEKIITIANGGNPAPINGSTGEEMEVYGSPVGQKGRVSFGEITIPFPTGSRLVLLTDGIVEAENPTGELYGEERLCDVIKSSKDLPIEKLKQEIAVDLEIFSEGRKVEDDVTFLILEA